MALECLALPALCVQWRGYQKVPAMEQLEFFTIPSPCRGVCEANSKGYCKGCLRSRDERLYWLQFSDTQKQHVLYLCLQRRKRLQQLAWQQRQADIGELWLPEQMDFEF